MKRLNWFMAVSILLAWGPWTAMPAQAGEKLSITMQVTSEGLITTDVAMVEKKIFLPRGMRVRLVLQYADINRDAHRFTLVSHAKERRSGTITPDGRKTATLEFTVGEGGVDFHRLSCELLCAAMDRLTDYLFMVRKA